MRTVREQPSIKKRKYSARRLGFVFAPGALDGGITFSREPSRIFDICPARAIHF